MTDEAAVTGEAPAAEGPGPEYEAHINIHISPNTIHYDSDLTLPEVAFWLETVKVMILQKVISDATE